jgi:hypothetical protein
MAGSNSVGSSFTPLQSDGNAGTNGFGGVLNGAANAAGLTFTLPAGASATGVSVDNPAPYWLRLTQTLASGVVPATGFVAQTALVHPQGSAYFAYNGDDQFSFVAQYVADPALGTVQAAGAMTVLPAASVVGAHRITTNFVNE